MPMSRRNSVEIKSTKNGSTLLCRSKLIALSLCGERHRKDEFLAILAHEFRNPLAPLRNALQIMEPANGGAVIRVRDNGTGIPTEMLPRIFEMFTQADVPPGLCLRRA